MNTINLPECIIPYSDLTKKELARLAIIRIAITNIDHFPERLIYARKGPEMASSDGKTYIAINREILSYPKINFSVLVALNLLHEVLHDPDKSEEYTKLDHGEPYFKRFHNATFFYLPELVEELNRPRSRTR